MTSPNFSIIIPAYNGADYIGETVQSVLNQTYPYFEIIVVDDASPDHTADVVGQFHDPRIKLIIHEKNMGSDIARNTGLGASVGDVIALLDQDDLYHPEKLRLHAEYLHKNPEVGFTYNARFELNYSSNTIRDLWRPSRNMTLADLVLWFPIAPSDAVIRREWVQQMGLDRSMSWTGGEIVYFGGLFLEGCKFGCVDRALNYRRHHSGRVIKDLIGGCKSEIAAQDRIFSDPRCPPDVIALKNIAHGNIYVFWAYRAFAQGETALGQQFIQSALEEKPSIVKGMPSELLNTLIANCDDDENLDHAVLLKKIFAQLPPGLDGLSEQYDWAVARGYLRRGVRAVMWNRPVDGQRYFEQAAKHGAVVDEEYLHQLARHLIDYFMEYGEKPTKLVLQNLSSHFSKLAGKAFIQRLEGCYAANLAFESYRAGQKNRVPARFISAIRHDPHNIRNRGLWSVFLRSIFES